MTWVIFQLLRIFTLLVWGIAGLVFWLPFLSRMTFFFSIAIIVSVSDGSKPRSAQIGLNKAVRFYPNGFRLINDSFNNLIDDEEIDFDGPGVGEEFWKTFLFHLVFSIVFWVATLFTIGFIVGGA